MSWWRTLRRGKRQNTNPFNFLSDDNDNNLDLTFDESPFYETSDNVKRMVDRIIQFDERSIQQSAFNISEFFGPSKKIEIAQLLTKHYHNYLCLKYQDYRLNELPLYFSNVLKIFNILKEGNIKLKHLYDAIQGGYLKVVPRQIHCIRNDDLREELFQRFQPALDFYVEPEFTDELGTLRINYDSGVKLGAALILVMLYQKRKQPFKIQKNENTLNNILDHPDLHASIEKNIIEVGDINDLSDEQVQKMMDYLAYEDFEDYIETITTHLDEIVDSAHRIIEKRQRKRTA